MRLWGHPIHPMLVHFPVAFWTVAAVAYIAAAAGVEDAATLAKFSNGAGLAVAMLAMIAGFMELPSIAGDAKGVAILHMTAMAAAWLCFVLALVTASSAGANLDKPTAQLVGVASASVGFLLMGVGGWLGGRLVYEFGIGVAARKE
jgi:uncharacterized membrane protein